LLLPVLLGLGPGRLPLRGEQVLAGRAGGGVVVLRPLLRRGRTGRRRIGRGGVRLPVRRARAIGEGIPVLARVGRRALRRGGRLGRGPGLGGGGPGRRGIGGGGVRRPVRRARALGEGIPVLGRVGRRALRGGGRLGRGGGGRLHGGRVDGDRDPDLPAQLG